jgi:hypothetical protein
MIVHTEIRKKLLEEFRQAKSIWVASAMISSNGWSFIQSSIPEETLQFLLIGIDLATDPIVFESILGNPIINARVYETEYTFHPKVYLIKKTDDSFTAFIGSSNTTRGGLDNNVEMNFQLNDQEECIKLLDWFNNLYADGYVITDDFISKYKSRFKKTRVKKKDIDEAVDSIKTMLLTNKSQFFSRNHHAIFNEKFHLKDSLDLQHIRKEVRDKFLKLHNEIYPQFNHYGLSDLHYHHQKREIVSRHFFNQFSGNYINAMWLHYGKSLTQLQRYISADKSINRPDSFINNIRMQVIIHEDSLGIWLVLGKNNGSIIDRKHFRSQMNNPKIRKDFFDYFNKLGNEYWLRVNGDPAQMDFLTPDQLWIEIQKESLDEYFIIGREIDWLDERLSATNISKTVLEEFKKLYPLYEIMRN